MSRQARRRRACRARKQALIEAVTDERLIEHAHALDEPDRSDWLLRMFRGELIATATAMLDDGDSHRFAFEVACELLRPFVEADVLDQHEAAAAARRAVTLADSGRAFSAAQRDGRLRL